MKKFLSLVMALVMVMSLIVVGASAKDFTDSDTINYDEAIDVISALEIVGGYTDGSFQPTTQLNRGQAAKIICNLILGVAAADNLVATKAPFPDVPATHHFAGYISYCAQEGIISGYPDGYFRPNNSLTGYAFMKMLLGALGYDQKNEGLVGTNWSIQVAKLVQGIGLDADLDGDFVGSKAVTREEACLFALNALQARTVEYKTPGSSITVNGVEINQAPSSASYRTYDAISVSNPGGGNDGNIHDADGYVQFAEEHFPRLVLSEGEIDDFGRPQHTWTYKGDKVGSYADAADATYEGYVTQADIYSDLKLTSTTQYFKVFIDGAAPGNFYTVGQNDYEDEGPDWVTDSSVLKDAKVDGQDYAMILKVAKDSVADGERVGTGNGCTIEVYKSGKAYDDDNGNDSAKAYKTSGTIVVTNTYVGEVISVNEAEGKRPANVEVAPVGDDVSDAVMTSKMPSGDFLNGDKFKATFDTTKFDVGDIVTFNYKLGVKGTSGSIKKLAKAESVEGEVKEYTNQESFVLGGTEYKYSKMATQRVDSNDIGTSVVAYLDKQGNVLYFTEGKDNNKNYALVLDAGMAGTVGGNTFSAELLFADGTTKIVTTDKQYGGTSDDSRVHSDADNDTCIIGEWVTYREDSRGRYVLTKPANNNENTVSTWANMMTATHKSDPLTASRTGIYTVGTYSTDNIGDIDNSNSANTSRLRINNKEARINSNTTIIIRTKADTFKVYHGVKEMPIIYPKQSDGITDNKIYYSVLTRYNQTYARFVYIDALDAKVTNRTNSDLFIVANSGAKKSDDGTDLYYRFNAVLDGKILTGSNGVKLRLSDPATSLIIDQLTKGKGNEILLSSYALIEGKYEVTTDEQVDGNKGTGLEFNDTYTASVERVTAEVIKISGTAKDSSSGDTFALAEGCRFFRVDASDVNNRVIESTWRGIGTGDIGDGTGGEKYAYVGISLNRDLEVTAVYWRLNK